MNSVTRLSLVATLGLLLAFFAFSKEANAQCSFGHNTATVNWDEWHEECDPIWIGSTTNCHFNDGNIDPNTVTGIDCFEEGEYIAINAVRGVTYTVDICNSAATPQTNDMIITLFNGADNSFLAESTTLTQCGNGLARVVYQANYTGTILIALSGAGCSTSSSDCADLSINRSAPCNFPDSPNIIASKDTICPDGWESTLLAVTPPNNSRGAAQWVWRRDSTEGVQVGTGATLSITPSSTTVYFPRGEGGCVTNPRDGGRSYRIVVADVTPPVLTCLPDDTLFLSTSCDTILPDYSSRVSVMDYCSSPKIKQEPAAGTIYNAEDVFTVLLSTKDSSGNVDTCRFTVSVIDNTPATITSSPSTQNVFFDANCQFELVDYRPSVTYVENCGIDVVVQTPIPGYIITSDTTVRIITRDIYGNKDSTFFDVLPTDNIDPAFTFCHTDTIFEQYQAGCKFTTPNYISSLGITTDDNCGIATLIQIPKKDSVLTSSTSVTFIAIDGNNNSISCGFYLSLSDTIPPSFLSCLNDTIEYFNTNCEYILPDYTTIAMGLAVDSCAFIYSQSPANGQAIFGDSTVYIIATDGAGNIDSCSFSITLKDSIKPSISVSENKVDSLLTSSPCRFELNDYTNDVFVTKDDNCTATSSVLVTQSPVPGSFHDTVVNVILTATDASLNSSSTSFTVTPVDVTAPVIMSGPANKTFGTNTNCNYILPDYATALTIIENCTLVDTIQSPTAGGAISANTTVTLTVIDSAGNSDVWSFDLTLIDTTPPTIDVIPDTVFDNYDVNCEFVIPDYRATVTANDNCDLDLLITQSPIGITATANTIITITVTDDAGLSKDSTLYLKLTDNISPTIPDCISTDTVPANLNCEFSLKDYGTILTFKDSCTPPGGFTYTQAPPSSATLYSSSQNVLFELTDAAGNTGQCLIKVTPQDTIPPTAVCLGDTTVYFNNFCSYEIIDFKFRVTTTDNCGAAPFFTQTPKKNTFASGNTAVTMYTHDENGNTNSCSFNLSVIDTTPPLLTCPAVDTIAFDNNCRYLVDDFTSSPSITVEDNCSSTFPSLMQFPAPGSLVLVHDTVIEITVSDNAGNNSICRINLHLNDLTPPNVLSLPTFQLELDANCEAIVPFYRDSLIPYVDDNCSEYSDLVFRQTPTPGSTVTEDKTVFVSYKDTSGNKIISSFLLDTYDNNATSVICPSNKNRFYTNTCDYIVEDFADSVSTLNKCTETITIMQSPLAGAIVAKPPGDSTIITLSIISSPSGETAQCPLTIKFRDIHKPIIVCIPDQKEEFPAGTCSLSLQDYTSTVAKSDNCDQDLIFIQTPVPGTLISDATEIVLVAEDDFNNTDTCRFLVIPFEQNAPNISCPGDQYMNFNASNCKAKIPDLTTLSTASDDCDPNPIITQIPAIGDSIFGNTWVKLIATDFSGNTDTCTFELKPIESVKPTITCPSKQFIPMNEDCEISLLDYTNHPSVIATDNCNPDRVIIRQFPRAGYVVSNDNLSETAVTLTADDRNGNTSTCSFQVRLVDNLAPSVSCPTQKLTRYLNAGCCYQVEDYEYLVTSVEDCDTYTYSQTPLIGEYTCRKNSVNKDSLLVTLLFTDASNNVSTCQLTVLLLDTIAPVSDVCINTDTLYLDINCKATVPNYLGVVTFLDNCDNNFNHKQTPITGDEITGNTTVVYIAFDDDGNSDTCIFMVVTLDTLAPTFSYPPVIFAYANDTCVAQMPDIKPFLTIDSDCSGVDPNINQSIAIDSDITSDQPVLISVSDSAGNIAKGVVFIVFKDSTPPDITCISDQDIPVDFGTCAIDIQDYTSAVTATDNCGGVITITQSPATGLASYPTVITMYATDESGNIDSCQFTVSPIDIFPPDISNCPSNHSVPLNETCQYVLPDYGKTVVITDNCGPYNYSQSPPAFFTVNDTTTIIITATDTSNNYSTCSVTITLVDSMPPFLRCPTDTFVEYNADCTWDVPNFELTFNIYDNCSPFIIYEQSPVPGPAGLNGGGEIIIIAEDTSGNKSTCAFWVSPKRLTNGGEITCPSPQPVELNALCEYKLPNYAQIASTCTDNKFDYVIIQEPPFNTPVTSDTLITLYLSNGSIYVDSCSFIQIVLDTVPPKVICPTELLDVEFNKNCEYIVPNYIDIGNVTVSCLNRTSVTQVPAPGSTIYGDTLVTITAFDNVNGKVGYCEFMLYAKLIENNPFYCPELRTLSVDSNCNAIIPDLETKLTVNGDCFLGYRVEQFPKPQTIYAAKNPITTKDSIEVRYWSGEETNYNTCYTKILLSDSIPPEITCPQVYSLALDDKCGAVMPDIGVLNIVQVKENCTNWTLKQGPISGTPLPNGPGVSNVTISIQDASGNTTTCPIKINRVDSTPPVIAICPDTVSATMSASDCSFKLPDYGRTILQISDNCTPNSSFEINQAPAASFKIFTNDSVFVEVTDLGGNKTTCAFAVTLEDKVPPTIDCDKVVYTAINYDCSKGLLPELGNIVEITDNCSEIKSFLQIPAVGTPMIGSVEVSVTAIDAFDNSYECKVTVELADSTAPTLKCLYGYSLPLNSDCKAFIPDFRDNISVDDNCSSDIFIKQFPVPNTVFTETGAVEIMVSALDPSGNADTCYFLTTIEIDKNSVHCSQSVFISNLITPNSDGNNDTWVVRGLPADKCIYKIYGRWGQLLYQSTSYNNDWDATVNGSPLPAGTYYYVIEYDGSVAHSGPLTILQVRK